MKKKSPDNQFAVVYKSKNKLVNQSFPRLVDAVLYWIRNAPDHAFIMVEGIRVDPKGQWGEFKKAVERFDKDQDVIIQAIRRTAVLRTPETLYSK